MSEISNKHFKKLFSHSRLHSYFYAFASINKLICSQNSSLDEASNVIQNYPGSPPDDMTSPNNEEILLNSANDYPGLSPDDMTSQNNEEILLNSTNDYPGSSPDDMTSPNNEEILLNSGNDSLQDKSKQEKISSYEDEIKMKSKELVEAKKNHNEKLLYFWDQVTKFHEYYDAFEAEKAQFNNEKIDFEAKYENYLKDKQEYEQLVSDFKEKRKEFEDLKQENDYNRTNLYYDKLICEKETATLELQRDEFYPETVKLEEKLNEFEFLEKDLEDKIEDFKIEKHKFEEDKTNFQNISQELQRIKQEMEEIKTAINSLESAKKATVNKLGMLPPIIQKCNIKIVYQKKPNPNLFDSLENLNYSIPDSRITSTITDPTTHQNDQKFDSPESHDI